MARWGGAATLGCATDGDSNEKGDVMFKTIIWATDGSEAADRALPTALELTAEANGRLLVVHANERLGGRAGGGPVFADEEDLQRKLETKAHDLLESDVNASFHVVSGLNTDPADLIADVAKESDADLIVVGTRGHGRVAGMLLGSVTQGLLHVAPCPVLAVPPKVAAPAMVGTA
jgi:nucleotide-binding universal stress UspA family protein